ncbi:MAG: hypothetical protein H6Q48_1641 [Deltaproteobacteria bacterium]|jgi:hypothetical protein|nr:hypothetical protein [Deltaproteobacteria bacterium]
MKRSKYAVVSWAETTRLNFICVGALGLLCLIVLGSPPAFGKPKIASGSQCSSDWVNNAEAMECFIQGEEESHTGVRHPHYVACAGGEVFCCVDDDRGNQDCVAQEGGRQTTQDDWIRAILAAQRTHLKTLTRKPRKTGVTETKTPGMSRERAP